jgi:hypothetical protein
MWKQINFGMDVLALFHPQMVFDFSFANLQDSFHFSKTHFPIEVPNCTQIVNANFFRRKMLGYFMSINIQT